MLFMSIPSAPFFLFVGSMRNDGATSKLSATGIPYVLKSLNSLPKNWDSIVAILQHPLLLGAVVKVTGTDYRRIASDDYRLVAARLIEALAAVPNVVLVHEAVVSSNSLEEDNEDEEQDEDEDEDVYYDWTNRFGEVPEHVRDEVHALFDSFHLVTTTYVRNVEISVLSAAFVEDQQSNLLFRLYVPAGRIYENELSKLIGLFHEWLGSVKRQTVRQGGYRTPRGQVFEFFAEDRGLRDEWQKDLQEFSNFLGLVEDPKSAQGMLESLGVQPIVAAQLVTKYAKEVRRVRIDMKQERESKILSIRHRLESDLAEEGQDVPLGVIEQVINQLIPATDLAGLPAITSLAAPQEHGLAPVITFNQQYIGNVEGIVAHTISGNQTFGTEALELLTHIGAHGGNRSVELTEAVHELEDSGAPQTTRLAAKSKLSGFLRRLGGHIETGTFSVLQKYLEQQIGI